MLCSQCHQREATMHFTVIAGDARPEKTDLCPDCATAVGLTRLTPGAFPTSAAAGKKCEFCDTNAWSGHINQDGRPTYWCFACGREINRFFQYLVMSEPPAKLRNNPQAISPFSLCADPEIQAWSVTAIQKAVQMLKEQRRQDGRDSTG
jgi:hypothetical protein